MQLTAIQLNTQHFKYYDAIVDYVESTQADIIGFQEVATGILTSSKGLLDPCAELAHTLGYHYHFAPRYLTTGGSQMGYAILSKYPISNSRMYYLSGSAVTISDDDALIATGMTDDRSLKAQSYELDQSLPSGILKCEVLVNDILIRCLTTKFPASPDHQESSLMGAHSDLIMKIAHSDDAPLIIMLDCNITSTAKSVQQLLTHYDQGCAIGTNTLNPTLHPGFAHGIPAQGLQVDYVFSQHLSHLQTVVDQVDISDHYPVRAKIDINQLKQCGKII